MKSKRVLSKTLSILLVISVLTACVFASVSTVSAEGAVYTETDETYHELVNFDDKSGGAPVNVDNGYSQSVYNASGRSFMFTVPAGDVVNVTDKSPSRPTFTFTANADMANAKYLQFWVKNTSADPVYIYNVNFSDNASFQYRLAAGADAQLIAENEKTVVNAVRWPLVTVGTTIQNSRSIKIPANFTGYVRLPLSAESMQIVAPSGGSFDAATLAKAKQINFHLGSVGEGGRVYFDDLGFVTGGEAVKAGAAFNELAAKKTYTDANGNTMAYRLYLPEGYDSITKYPVVLYLHGNGFQGNDNVNHVIGEMGEPLDELVYLGNRSEYPAIIVAPQCPTGDKWVNTTFANGSYSLDSVAETAAMGMVLDLLKEIQANYSTDENRVYAMGVSMGAFGCWDMMMRHPGVLDAAVPMMGAGDPSKAASIGNTAVWAFHSNSDTVVPSTGSTEMVNALQAIAGTNAKYTEYTNVGHSAYRLAVSNEDLLPWLFAQGDIYVNDKNEEYHSISGFEVGETAVTVNNGTTATDVKNNGAQSQKVTVGDSTNANAKFTFTQSPTLAGASYLQFWVNNATGTDQYLAGMNLLGTGYQFNIPVGATSLLIEDGSATETAVTWKNVSIGGLGTIRTLLIPAGFSGYVRISLAEQDLEIKAGTYNADNLNAVQTVSMYVGNTATGGNVYIDDIGYVTPLTVKTDAFANDITLPICGFESDEQFSAMLGSAYVSSTVKEAGEFEVALAEGDKYANPVVLNASNVAHASAAEYVQFTIRNDSAIAQSLFNFNLSIDSSNSVRFRLTKNTEVYLVDAQTKQAVAATWVSQYFADVGTFDCLSIPAGFNGTVRISLAQDGLEVRSGEYSASNVGKIRIFNFFVANTTTTAGTVTLDDFAFVDVIDELPEVVGVQIRESDNNLRFVMKHNQAVMDALTAEYASVEYGTVVVNASAFGGGKELVVTTKTSGFGSANPTTLKNTSAFTPEGWAQDNYRVYSFVITNMNTAAKKATPIAVRAYIKVTDANGAEHVLYSFDKYQHKGYQVSYNAVADATAQVGA